MTVVQEIESRIVRLKPFQQKALLTFLDTLELSNGKASPGPKRRKSRKAEVLAAVRGIAGMWKDRTDLPKDPVEAVKVLRTRMSSRGRNA